MKNLNNMDKKEIQKIEKKMEQENLENTMENFRIAELMVNHGLSKEKAKLKVA